MSFCALGTPGRGLARLAQNHGIPCLLIMCVFALYFHFWLTQILGVACLLTACDFALHFDQYTDITKRSVLSTVDNLC